MISFRTLGLLDLRDAEGAGLDSVLAQPKRTALLAYLAVATPPGFHRRDLLAALFWPELDENHARSSLRSALHFLRRSLGQDSLLTRGNEEVSLNWNRFSCDATVLCKALEDGRLEEALDVHRGDFLSGFHVDGSGERRLIL